MDQLNFFSQEYNASKTYLRTTETPRCIKSLENLMFGLYPSLNQKSLNKRSTTSIPTLLLNTISTLTDNASPNYDLCPLVQVEMNKRVASYEYQSYRNNTVVPLLNKMASIFNINASLLSMNTIGDIMFCLICHNKSLPKGFDMDFAVNITEVKF